jgi:hypothetical protein
MDSAGRLVSSSCDDFTSLYSTADEVGCASLEPELPSATCSGSEATGSSGLIARSLALSVSVATMTGI